MNKGRDPDHEIPSPDDRAVPDPSRRSHDAIWTVTQQLHELHGDVIRSSTILDRLEKSVDGMSGELRGMRD